MDRFYTAKAPIRQEKTYQSEDIRLSVITSRILRVERHPQKLFEERDGLYKAVADRSFPIRENPEACAKDMIEAFKTVCGGTLSFEL